jgi:hypothetical protein
MGCNSAPSHPAQIMRQMPSFGEPGYSREYDSMNFWRAAASSISPASRSVSSFQVDAVAADGYKKASVADRLDLTPGWLNGSIQTPHARIPNDSAGHGFT